MRMVGGRAACSRAGLASPWCNMNDPSTKGLDIVTQCSMCLINENVQPCTPNYILEEVFLRIGI